MKFIKPIEFQSAMLISTTAVDEYAAYSSATTYAKDAIVTYGTKYYTSLVNSNLNKTPGAVGSETFWLEKSESNRYAMFDKQVGSQTKATTSLTVKIAPGTYANSIGFVNVENVQTIQINVTNSGSSVYTKTISLDNTVIVDWYMYFFEPYDLSNEFVTFDLPPYLNAEIEVIFTGSAGQTISIGVMTFGTLYTIGGTNYGLSGGIRDYSVKETDEFGNTTFVERAFSRRMTATADFRNTELSYVSKQLSSIRAVPVLWVGADGSDYSSFTIYGYYRDFTIEIPQPTHSVCQLEIEGLT